MSNPSATRSAELTTYPVIASAKLQALLRKLHELSETQEKSWSQKLFYLMRLVRFMASGETWSAMADNHMRDKFVALEEDKCQFIYLLARAMRARNVVEAGSSFGVSTIYLALAVGQNVQHELQRYPGVGGKVIATEKETSKAAKAREYWKEAGNEVEPWIELREGDLLETLRVEEGMPEEIDLLLLDIWTPLALPTLKLLQPRLKHGAVVITDNVGVAKFLYRDFLAYVRNSENGFRTLKLPFKGGLECSVFLA
ncbi:S-adenosyl-L-methionine-dependent methyltransferase [Microdochium trichocladiopsis]|uniref:S-adenosyl-L-methionine-dependent methyltransferase n=1 Tax=Microdochium trichocladiopsis TaxID=1682393 RepID=A0A9P9BQ78_9PEZI|nr:S-adenosyl-L-methionine-dependent methyltransferase [Microdochium trichocladiopsis]KAH7030558.1 S-adenosyl-L-methionine-dependent methyltransferase [Microdochium trichocladiopsis]